MEGRASSDHNALPDDGVLIVKDGTGHSIPICLHYLLPELVQSVHDTPFMVLGL